MTDDRVVGPRASAAAAAAAATLSAGASAAAASAAAVAASTAAANATAIAVQHGERLAVVETKLENVGIDVTEIKGDVKVLLTHRDGQVGSSQLLTRVAPWAAILIAIAAAFRAS